MRALACLACLAATGCGRLGFGTVVAASDATSGDASGDGDGPSAGVCPPTVVIDDDFEDGAVAPEWTALDGNNLTRAETGGFLQITFASNVPAGQVAGYQQTVASDFTGTCVIAELAELPNPATLAQAEIRIGSSTDCAVVNFNGGQLHAAVHRGANITRLPDIAADLASQRFVRLREVAGVWFFETSSDGTHFVELGNTTKFASQVNTTLRLVAATGSGINNGGELRFASVRVFGP